MLVFNDSLTDCMAQSTEDGTGLAAKKQTLHEMIASVPDFSLKVQCI
jgi:hypothetical protein